MTGPEHYKEAERLIDGAQESLAELGMTPEEGEVATVDHFIALGTMAALAQVHATLALAAATATISNRPADDHATWTEAVSDAG